MHTRHRFTLSVRHAGDGIMGHILSCIIEKDTKTGTSLLHFLTKRRRQWNAQASGITQKDKRSYKFDPIVLRDPSLLTKDSPITLEVFDLLKQYRENSSPSNINNYHTKEIYQLFMQLGNVQVQPQLMMMMLVLAHNEVLLVVNKSSV